MRIDNDYFLIVIERKKREQKSADKNKKKALRWKIILPAVLLLVVVLYISVNRFGHNPETAPVNGSEEILVKSDDTQESEPDSSPVEGNYITTHALAANTQEKYADQNIYGYDYGEPIQNLKRNESIELELGFDPEDVGVEYWSEICTLYEDPQLKYERYANMAYDEKTSAAVISPGNSANLYISTMGLNTEQVNRYDHSGNMFFEKDSGTDWGNQGTLYLAIYKDLKTGKDLSKPLVKVITLQGEVEEAPQISFSIKDDGRASFSWNPVQGAEEYFICRTDWDSESGFSSTGLWIIGQTKETEWTEEAPEYGMLTYTNSDFKFYDMSEEDWYDDYSSGRAKEKYGIEKGVYVDIANNGIEYYGVIAVSKDGSSMVSNLFSAQDLAPNLPYCAAYNAQVENGYNAIGYLTVEELVSYGYVTMCDGHTVPKLINYKTEEAKVVEQRYINFDDDGNPIGGENALELQIPYTIEGTPFEDVAAVQDYDKANLEKDLKAIEDREDKLRKRSGDVAVSKDIEIDEENLTADTQVRQLEDVEITANSALSEYLASHMLGGASIIDLSEFREASDFSLTEDAWMEAYYQNPLILGVTGYRLNKKGTAMRVVYENTPEELSRKQKEILEIIPKIIDEIITEDMTDLEKELAINEYLCETIEYDEEALENAEIYDFKKVDEEYYDSFTAYGALKNGKCVCAGYAAAFKLLADEAGLDAIVVTGILEGSLSHAWNKVCIDGEWEIVDTTNNDNEYIFNALLNLPNTVGDKVLVEDDCYIMDNYLSRYQATEEENEYYRISSLYYQDHNIAEKLAEGLEENGSVTLRTDYDLDDERFSRIAGEVYDIMGHDVDLYGYHWMGVIYLTLDQ